MSRPRWLERLLSSTRGRVLALLRGEERTVSDLAVELELTDNAVRRHLATLEGEGMVEVAGRRRGTVGKPARVYRLTTEGREFFPDAYGLLLGRVLDVLERTEPSVDVEELLEEVGRELGRIRRDAGFPTDEGVAARTRAAADVLVELGGLPEVESSERGLRIRGRSCPLEALAEALLSELLGVPVRESCDRSDPPRCRFEVGHVGGG